MTAPTPIGFIDFFVLEGSEYVDQLDALLQSGTADGPNAESMLRAARALRGSATMAKLPGFAELAAAIERVSRSLLEKTSSWNAALSGALVAAIDECKVLLRNARAWSDADTARAQARVAELGGYGAARAPRASAATAIPVTDGYLSTETSNIGAGLELLATRPVDRGAAANVLRRIRALRGIATVKDHASLSDVLEAAEEAVLPMELEGNVASASRIALLGQAAALLREISALIRGSNEDELSAERVSLLMVALDTLLESESDAQRVVPVADLFFDDGEVGVVDRAASPPMTLGERFRLEAVGQGEHLRRLATDARSAEHTSDRNRMSRQLRRALRGLEATAQSFGEGAVARFVVEQHDAVVRLDALALEKLNELAALLAEPLGQAGPLAERIDALLTIRAPMMTPLATSIVAPVSGPAAGVGAMSSPALPRGISSAKSPASRMAELLDQSIEKLQALSGKPLSDAAPVAEQPIVPIEILLYRGRSAIERCRDIRDDARSRGRSVDDEALSELFDLLDLALTA